MTDPAPQCPDSFQEANSEVTAQANHEVQVETDSKLPPQGHGRNGAAEYTGAEKIAVPHASLQPGDLCPKCEKGTVYDSRPGVLVRLVGQSPIQAKIYELQKLRCNLCGIVFTAQSPD